MRSTAVALGWSLLFMSVVSDASASDFNVAYIDAVRPDNFDVGGFFVKVSGTMAGSQTCTAPDGASYNWYFIRKDNPMMKELLSAALSAKIADRAVSIAGKGTCTQGFEDVRYIQLN